MHADSSLLNRGGQAKALSVTQLLRKMKMLLEVEIGEVWIEGEVSNLRKQGSGHWYFSLKDEGAQISCAMFGARRRQGAEVLRDGARVKVFAEASVYEARGQLQVIVQQVVHAGLGDLQARFEALKQKLQAEGLFDAERKKEIPKFPRVIGLITSESGAALQDMLQVLGRRAPWVQPVLCPVRVQGKGAEMGIAAAIQNMGDPEAHGFPRCDVLIVGRGGGSLEDLWNFNEEVVARAIAACPIPVISAVGHEIDFTIADFVADLRAPTPSAAAELAVADGAELATRVRQLDQRMKRRLRERVQSAQLILQSHGKGMLRHGGERLLREPMMRLDALRGRMQQGVKEVWEEMVHRVRVLEGVHRSHHPKRVLERRCEVLKQLQLRLGRAAEESLREREQKVESLGGMLRALGPESAFQRGFSITMDQDGNVIRSLQSLEEGDAIRTKLLDGEVQSRVTKKEERLS